ncbi:MAG TPA: outer membrane beta-barrel protein [Gemmatimonadaceae bacterium]|nr:outer membrane beta-barrel protein [Gemmatimonadaceae bacterium]
MKKSISACAIGLCLMVASPLHAQRQQTSGPWELGIDAGVMFGLGDQNITVVSVPFQTIRAGYFLTNKAEIEPRISINSIHGGGESLTTYDFQLGLLLMPHGDRIGNGIYIRPFLGVSGIDVSGAGNNNSGYAGAGLGLKIPLTDRRMGIRLESNYAHGFSDGGSDVIGVGMGLSWFTR